VIYPTVKRRKQFIPTPNFFCANLIHYERTKATKTRYRSGPIILIYEPSYFFFQHAQWLVNHGNNLQFVIRYLSSCIWIKSYSNPIYKISKWSILVLGFPYNRVQGNNHYNISYLREIPNSLKPIFL